MGRPCADRSRLQVTQTLKGTALGPHRLWVWMPPPCRSSPTLLPAHPLSAVAPSGVNYSRGGDKGRPFTFLSNRLHTLSFQICRYGWFGDSHQS